LISCDVNFSRKQPGTQASPFPPPYLTGRIIKHSIKSMLVAQSTSGRASGAEPVVGVPADVTTVINPGGSPGQHIIVGFSAFASTDSVIQVASLRFACIDSMTKMLASGFPPLLHASS